MLTEEARKPIAMNKPVHKNICEDCVFLGTYYSKKDKKVFDLYMHKVKSENKYSNGKPLMVARYGNEKHEYFSAIGSTSQYMLYATVLALRIGALTPQDLKGVYCDLRYLNLKR